MREQMSVLYTVGFSGKDAKTFFELLKLNNVQTLLDIRLNNVSQLSGYTKKNDILATPEKSRRCILNCHPKKIIQSI